MQLAEFVAPARWLIGISGELGARELAIHKKVDQKDGRRRYRVGRPNNGATNALRLKRQYSRQARPIHSGIFAVLFADGRNLPDPSGCSSSRGAYSPIPFF